MLLVGVRNALYMKNKQTNKTPQNHHKTLYSVNTLVLIYFVYLEVCN